MKLTKKKVFVSALALCLVAILSMGTLAWFNASDEVTNNFLIADSDQDNDNLPDFSVDVLENTPDGNAKPDDTAYPNIQPGDVRIKTPYAKNTGMYDQYVRMVVTLSDAKTWMDAAKKYGLTSTNYEALILERLTTGIHTDWKRYEMPTLKDNVLTYVYYYDKALASGQASAAIFNTITIPGDLQQADMDFGDSKGFEIKVKLDAVQTANMPDTNPDRNAAYEAFAYVGWTAGEAYGN